MTDARFVHGHPTMVDHTPGSAVAAGDVVVVGAGVRICHTPIEADRKGALALRGGIYEMKKASAVEIAAGTPCFWNATTGVTATSTDTPLGTTAEAAVDGQTTVLVAHEQPPAIGT